VSEKKHDKYQLVRDEKSFEHANFSKACSLRIYKEKQIAWNLELGHPHLVTEESAFVLW
jgi:hypothetical protein